MAISATKSILPHPVGPIEKLAEGPFGCRSSAENGVDDGWVYRPKCDPLTSP